MAHQRYFIVFDEGHWRIKHSRRLSEPHASQSAAIRAAIEAANRAGSFGDQAEVLVHGNDLLFSAVWIYGLDTYPPPEELFDLAAHSQIRQTSQQNEVTLAGASVQCPCHVCAFFNGADEQYGILLPFVREGYAYGERSLHLLDYRERDNRLSKLSDFGIDVEEAQRTGQLQIEVWENAYLRGGRFDPARMVEFVNDALIAGRQRGFARTRVWANMEWALIDAPGVEALADYESRFNSLLPQTDDAVVCAYDVARFPAATLENVIKAHPYLLADGWGRENQHYVPPSD